MLRSISSIILVGMLFSKIALANNLMDIVGYPTNYLEPHILLEKHGANWNVEIDLLALTNFDSHAWLKTTNAISSKLQLWSADGTEVSLTNASALAAFNLPSPIAVADIIQSVRPKDRRGLQWLWTRQGSLSGVAVFDLPPEFKGSVTNDVVLGITPLIYKVETNEATADLVEFPPIKIKLLADGEAKKIEK